MVHKAITGQTKGGRIARIVKTFDESGSTFEVKFTKRGKDREIVVGMDGKLITREVFLLETPKDVQATMKKQMGKGDILQILRTMDDGETCFQVQIVKDRETQERTMNVAINGTMTSL